MVALAKKYHFWCSLLVIVCCCLPAVFGLFHMGFIVTDDGNWMVIRFSAFYEALRAGQFPVRFLMRLNNGYGYPVSDFLYPLYMYLGVPIKAVGFSFVSTIKILFGLSIVGSGLFTFLWLRKKFSLIASVLGALVYVYFPYHLYDIYQRGSLGEVLALALVPFILWQIERRKIIFISLGLAALILSHNILALLFLPVLIGYLLVKQFSFRSIVWIMLGGLGLASFFWIPALYDKQFTVFDTTPVSDFSHYFVSNTNASLSGLIGLLGLFFCIGGLLKQKNSGAWYMLGVGLVSLFLSLPLSGFVWHMVPLGTYVQFPFRFLSISVMTTSFLLAYGYDRVVKKRFSWIALVGVIVVLGISSFPYLMPKAYQAYPDGWYTTNMDTTTIKNEYMPRWVKQIPMSYPTEKVIIGEDTSRGTAGIVSNLIATANKTQFSLLLKKKSSIIINTIYFPGWNVWVNGKEQPISYANPRGVMQFSLPAGSYVVKAQFGETEFRLISDLISLIALTIIGSLFVKNKIKTL